MRIQDTGEILRKLGYDYYTCTEPEVKPELVDVRFIDILPELAEGSGHSRFVSGKKLYKHQYEAFKHLSNGYNIVLKSGTGSGKTEAWLLYVFKYRVPALAVYPTLALANDQIKRIKDYCQTLGYRVEQIDAKTKEALWRSGLRTGDIRRKLRDADIVITNPAFLMMELKRWAMNPRNMLLDAFLGKVKLIVFDEFDFYGPREIALLMAMMSILREISESNFQIAVMTATLGNPEELAEYLKSVNDRDTAIVEGRPFKVQNRTYIVLGKNLQAVWRHISKHRDAILRGNVGEDVKRALEDYEHFKNNVFKVLEVAEALGLDVPKIEFDISEILSKYVEDDGVTLVFTRSIATAEQYARRLKSTIGDKGELVASHHHLISKAFREEIERKARAGEMKVIFSPRTLSQGIDIGTIIRIVHLGLPEDVREFHQREGRKGRREEIPFTESIIIPFSKWDRELLSRGLDAFIEWLNLPLEHVIVNTDNKYMMLFKALFHVVSSRHSRRGVSEEEYKFLKSLGLVEGPYLSSRGKRTWINMNFYEYSPPYGIKRVRIRAGEEEYLEDISHCDLVEKFQIGCFDYTSDSIVTRHRLGGRSGRTVIAVEVEPISYGLIWKHEALAEAFGEYEKIKRKWGEEPSILSDYNLGRLYSEVLCTVRPPTSGFGKLYKFPSRVTWYVVERKSRIVRADSRTIAYRERRPIEVPTPTYGMYTDYTYGITMELSPDEDLTWLRIGLAYLMVILRRVYNIPLETIMYDVVKIGEMKLMNLHEPESAGLLEKIDWSEVARVVEKYEPTPLDEILLQAADDIAHLDFVDFGLRWDIAKKFTLRALNYLILRQKIAVKVKDKVVYLPKPSKALKVFSIDAISLPVYEEGNVAIYVLGVFDGDQEVVRSGLKEWYIISKDREAVERKIMDLINEDFKAIVFNYSGFINALNSMGLKHLLITFEGLRSMNKVVDLQEPAVKYFGSDQVALETIGSALGVVKEAYLTDLKLYYDEFLSKIKGLPYSRWWNYSKLLKKYAEKHLANRLRTLYILYLLLREEKVLHT